MERIYDAVIIGGGAAGLGAALTLGRSCRNVVVCDDGRPRNAVAQRMHGFITRDGTPPREMLDLARRDLERYPAVKFLRAHVTHASKDAQTFVVMTQDGSAFRARSVLLAIGVFDVLPDIDGIEELWGRRVFVCPYCDAWEVRGKRLAVAATGRRAVELAQELWQWSDDLLICCQGEDDIDSRQRSWIQRVHATLRHERLAGLTENSQTTVLHFTSGGPEECAALFVRAPLRQRYPLVGMLGVQIGHNGNISVDNCGRTCVQGVYAAGDAVTEVHQVVLAAASGVRAAMALNEDLLEQDVANALR